MDGQHGEVELVSNAHTHPHKPSLACKLTGVVRECSCWACLCTCRMSWVSKEAILLAQMTVLCWGSVTTAAHTVNKSGTQNKDRQIKGKEDISHSVSQTTRISVLLFRRSVGFTATITLPVSLKGAKNSAIIFNYPFFFQSHRRNENTRCERNQSNNISL